MIDSIFLSSARAVEAVLARETAWWTMEKATLELGLSPWLYCKVQCCMFAGTAGLLQVPSAVLVGTGAAVAC